MAYTLHGMDFLVRSRMTHTRIPGGPLAPPPLHRGAGSRKGQYWRGGISLVRRSMMLLMIALVALVVLAAGAESIRP
jgi:hypothetical protein